MEIQTINEHAETEALLKSLPAAASVAFEASGRFSASCYEPNDILRGTHCYAQGDTLAEAIAGMLAKVEVAKTAGKRLRTAAECKQAVIALINEYDAATASFRDAVDALSVA